MSSRNLGPGQSIQILFLGLLNGRKNLQGWGLRLKEYKIFASYGTEKNFHYLPRHLVCASLNIFDLLNIFSGQSNRTLG